MSPQSEQGMKQSYKSARSPRHPDNREDPAGIQPVKRFASRGMTVLSSPRLLPLEASERFFRALRTIVFQ
jgi:hypothetical protein